LKGKNSLTFALQTPILQVGGGMFKKAFKRLTNPKKEPTPKKSTPSPEKPKAKILTAEGWKRLMMKKYRK
jgi:hypothetical protein